MKEMTKEQRQKAWGRLYAFMEKTPDPTWVVTIEWKEKGKNESHEFAFFNEHVADAVVREAIANGFEARKEEARR